MKRKLFAYENLMGNHDKILKVEKVAAWKKRSDIQQKQVTSQLSTININLGSTVQFCQVLSLCKGSLLSSCLAQNTGCSAHTAASSHAVGSQHWWPCCILRWQRVFICYHRNKTRFYLQDFSERRSTLLKH